MADADREKWDARYGAEIGGERAPPEWLDAHDALFPREGRALDLAAGSGRISRWAAGRGLAVTAVDISEVGLRLLSAALPEARVVARDLELEPNLPRGPYALVACFHYRQPSLWPAMKTVLGPGGILLAEALTVINLEQHEHPSKRWLLEAGELEEQAAGLEVLYSEEGWFGGRHCARLIARKASA